ncbi:TIGR03749 family integrating conjugative element protein [Serratia ureilytica]
MPGIYPVNPHLPETYHHSVPVRAGVITPLGGWGALRSRNVVALEVQNTASRKSRWIPVLQGQL